MGSYKIPKITKKQQHKSNLNSNKPKRSKFESERPTASGTESKSGSDIEISEDDLSSGNESEFRNSSDDNLIPDRESADDAGLNGGNNEIDVDEYKPSEADSVDTTHHTILNKSTNNRCTNNAWYQQKPAMINQCDQE